MSNENVKRITVGVLAHVDAGKTTLCESMLYLTGQIRNLGRVDAGNTHLDTNAIERQRGITIFSSQATLRMDGCELTLLDTPGHVDFAAEMERTLSVLDYAVLVISGTDGVQAHTETLWRLLTRYRIPVFIFVTKMDMPETDKRCIAKELRTRLDGACAECGAREAFTEDAASLDEALLEKYLNTGDVSDADVAGLIAERRLFPYFFGSGLKMEGVEAFLQALSRYTVQRAYPNDFGARVFKISRDAQDQRLTWMKLTGGTLKVRAPLRYTAKDGEKVEEKAAQLRVYAGDRFEACESLSAGSVCAVTGLMKTYPGQGLGCETEDLFPVLQSVLTYRILPPPDVDARVLLPKLRILEEEDPQLHILWDERLREIQIQFMGEVQTEVLKALIKDRFGFDVTFDEGRVLYRETIDAPTEGLGHFEPLRHYAEVRLLLEPLPRGSGLAFASQCPIDTLAVNYQHLILTHLAEKRHHGVLTGAPVTDMKITILTGRAHLKHTEGGDFRQATYRAVRQGLMRAQSVLLEPYYAFRMELPAAFIGRALTDIERMSGTVQPPDAEGETAILTGRAPVSAMRSYAKELTVYTRGRGRLSCCFDGYDRCHNTAEVLAQTPYFPESDMENSPDSIFCSHGAGINVKWHEVESYMHTQSTLAKARAAQETRRAVSDAELEAIMLKTVGPIKRPLYSPPAQAAALPEHVSTGASGARLLIDGYNVIFAWEELKALSEESLEAAREALMDILCEYRAVTEADITLVFDAYRTDNRPQETFDYRNIHVVFTAKDESADVYIAKALNEAGEKFRARVVTSDHLIRLAAWGGDALMTESRDFQTEVEAARTRVREIIQAQRHKTASSIGERLDNR